MPRTTSEVDVGVGTQSVNYPLLIKGFIALVVIVAIGMVVVNSISGNDTGEKDLDKTEVDPMSGGVAVVVGGVAGIEKIIGTNDSEDKAKTAEKDIVAVTMGSKTYRIDVNPATCDSNLKITSIDMEKFDLRSIDSEGVWFIRKPLVEIENADKGIIFATVVIERKNLEKFFLEFDGVEFQNLHSDDDNNIYVDIKTDNRSVQVETFATMEVAKKITHNDKTTTSASKNNFLLAENVCRDWNFLMLRITLSRYTY